MIIVLLFTLITFHSPPSLSLSPYLSLSTFLLSLQLSITFSLSLTILLSLYLFFFLLLSLSFFIFHSLWRESFNLFLLLHFLSLSLTITLSHWLIFSLYISTKSTTPCLYFLLIKIKQSYSSSSVWNNQLNRHNEWKFLFTNYVQF